MGTSLQYRTAKSPQDFPQDFAKKAEPFARDFGLLGTLIEKSGADGEAFTLYISTCRNAYLTINGMFLDIRETFGRISPSSGLLGALQEAQGGAFVAMGEHLQEVGLALSVLDEKCACWQRREAFHTLLESLLGQFSHWDQASLKDTLFDVIDQDERSELASVRQFLAFDSTETDEQASLIQKLTVTAKKLRCVRDVAIRIRTLSEELRTFRLEGAPNGRQATLFDELSLSPAFQHGMAEFRKWLDTGSKDTEMELVNEAMRQTVLHHPSANEILAGGNRPEATAKFLEVFSHHLQDATGKEYRVLGASFRPNIAKAPLPSMFLIDLTVPLPPKADIKRAAVATPILLSEAPLDKLAIAIAQPPISSSEISDRDIRYRDEGTRQIASEWASLAIQAAAAAQAKLIIFPELFMPEGSLGTIHEIAKKAGIAVVCGVEGSWMDSKYSNFANIDIPGVLQIHKQFKKYPSNQEPETFYSKGGQLCFLRSSIGSFSVVLCSDFREFDVIAAIEGQPFLDYLVICCCNPYTDLWKQVAVADAARLHSFVVIANWSSDGDEHGFGRGSYCVAPTRNIEATLLDNPHTKKVSILKGDKVMDGSLLLHDLDIAALFRDREKPKPGFLSPPKRRLHINQ